MGVPASSVNCLEGCAFLSFVLGTGAIRVPKPAAGIMATTFMAGCQYTSDDSGVQICWPHRPSCFIINWVPLPCSGTERVHVLSRPRPSLDLGKHTADLPTAGRHVGDHRGPYLLAEPQAGESALACESVFQILRSTRSANDSRNPGLQRPEFSRSAQTR